MRFHGFFLLLALPLVLASLDQTTEKSSTTVTEYDSDCTTKKALTSVKSVPRTTTTKTLPPVTITGYATSTPIKTVTAP